MPQTSPPGVKYRSIDALAVDLKKGGLECADLTYLKQNNPTLKEFALCDPEHDANQRLDIYLFEKSGHRNQWIGSIVQSGFPWLLGPNWIIVAGGDPTTAEDRLGSVQEAIGGKVPEVQF